MRASTTLGDVLGRSCLRRRSSRRTRRSSARSSGRPGFAAPPARPGSLPEYYGSPDTVAGQLVDAAKVAGYGVADLIFTGDKLPHEKALRSLALFGKEVLPQLRAA